MMELFDFELHSGAYKVRLFLQMLGVSYTPRRVEFYPAREHQSAWFLRLSPRGELPVLVDDGSVIEGAGSILTYLAGRYDEARHWYPARDTTQIGQMSKWLSLADALTRTAGAARLHDAFLDGHIDVHAARSGARELLRMLDEHLWFSQRIASGWIYPSALPTIADLACFPDVVLAPEGGIDLTEYRAVRRWTERVKELPNFVPMPGIFSR
jgi:glutathione S-transferase